jgi:sortase A
MTRRHTALRWIEWSLLAIGAAVGVWCVVAIVEVEYTKRMPVPPPPLTVTQTLPGDAGSSKTTPMLPGDAGSPESTPAPSRGNWVARLEAPSVQMIATVLEGSDDATLKRGAGHIEDTPLPGQAGNIGIAGHRDTIFRPLRRVRVGDPLDLTTRDRIYHFRIATTSIVSPTDVHVLDPTDQPTLTLVTCYPFEFIGHAPRRFIVQARLVDQEARVAQAADPVPAPR